MGQNPKDNASNQIPRTINSSIRQNGNDIEMEEDEGSTETNADLETNTSSETARKKAFIRHEQKFFEKTRGNRHEETKLFITQKFVASHLQQDIISEIISTSLSVLKMSNNIEQKQRTQQKFEDAIRDDPDLPFIPRSATRFELACSDDILGTQEFIDIRQRVENLTRNFNNEISKAAQQVGSLELINLFHKRTKLIIKMGLTLAHALTIEYAYRTQGGQNKRLNGTLPAIALYHTLCTQRKAKLQTFLHSTNQNLKSMIQEETKENIALGQNENFNIDLVLQSDFYCTDEGTEAINDISEVLTMIIDAITFEAWDNVILKHQERMREVEIKSCFQKLKIANATKATEQALKEEKPVSQQVLQDLVDSIIESTLKHKTKQLRKKFRAEPKTKLCSPQKMVRKN